MTVARGRFCSRLNKKWLGLIAQSPLLRGFLLWGRRVFFLGSDHGRTRNGHADPPREDRDHAPVGISPEELSSYGDLARDQAAGQVYEAEGRGECGSWPDAARR